MKLFFIHGLGGSNNTWKEANKHLSNFELIKIELPGHGNNQSIDNPELEFTINHLTDTISHEINDQIKKEDYYAIITHSLGGHLILQGLDKINHKPNHVVLSGAPPIQLPYNPMQIFKPHPGLLHAYKNELNANEKRELEDAFFGNSNVASFFWLDFDKVNPHFKPILGADMQNPSSLIDEVEVIKNNNSIQFHAINGANENVVNLEYIDSLKSNNFSALTIPNAYHFPMVETAEEYMQSLIKCLGV